ncbi:MAG: TetR/AcrR family transcriptional regulator [Eubacteriales bacterium]|nr:TetR/AcrR family transcriptional regulator [Eubacteriales bacterium]
MPPKPKFTREEMVAAALDLVGEKGMEALTARNLGDRLGTSSRPIFTMFKNMEEVQEAVREAVVWRYDEFAKKAMQYTPAFKQFGMQMVLFAMEEPNLYRLMFLDGGGKQRNFEQVFADLGETAVVCLEILQRDYGLTAREAKMLFQHVWIHTYGVATLCATKMCSFSFEEINDLLGQDFMAMLARIKSGGIYQATPQPVEKM